MVRIEVIFRRCSVIKVLLKISQNSQGSTCVNVTILIKLQAKVCNFIRKGLWHSYFTVTFAKFLRTPFFIEDLRWLLLYAYTSMMNPCHFFPLFQCVLVLNSCWSIPESFGGRGILIWNWLTSSWLSLWEVIIFQNLKGFNVFLLTNLI